MELAKAQDIEILNNDGELVTDDFIKNMELYQSRRPGENTGIVWRWLIGYRGRTSNALHLMVQALPCNLQKIKSTPELREEHTKGITYATFENAEVPTPTFFSKSPPETNKKLKESPEFAYKCMMALAEKFLLVGEISR